MFDFFKKNKEYVSCEDFQGGIHFDYSGLFYCATYSHSHENNKCITPIVGDLNKNYKMLIETKKQDKKSFEKVIVIPRCKDCFQLKKKQWKKNQKINRVAISANKKCNSNCIYCTTHCNKAYLNTLPDIPIYNFIKKLIDDKHIDDDCVIQFGGGEPTLHFEFEKIVDLFLEKLEPMLRIYSSGIKFSSHIEKAIKLGRCTLIISLDSGNPNLYKKIKNVDEFSTVVNNVAKYCKAQDELPERKYVILKYILIPGVNDKEEYIYEFLSVAKQINCQEVRCDLEQEWYKRNKNNFDLVSPLFYIMKYFDLQAKKMGLVHFFNVVPFRLIEMYTEKVYESIQIDENLIK